MQSFNPNFDLPPSAYVRRRLAEATLLQDRHDGSRWQSLDPGPTLVASSSERAQSLHNALLSNALRHVRTYMCRKDLSLAIGELLEAQIDSDHDESSSDNDFEHTMQAECIQHPGVPPLDQGAAESSAETPSTEQSTTLSLASPPKRAAVITFHDDEEGSLKALQNVDIEAVSKRCPLLGMAFENSRSGPQLFLETLSSRTAEPFLRFLHSGSYAYSETDEDCNHYEDAPTSILLHCELYRLGHIYDLQDLKKQAYVNVLRQCEYGCSSSTKPIDLCAAVRFVYAHLEKHEGLIDAIINYCVSCFLRHRLAEDSDFKHLAHDLRPFHQDLCRNCMKRDFENDTAAAIIQMPFKPHQPETYASIEYQHSFDDLVYHFHGTDEADMETGRKRKRPTDETVLPIRSAQMAWAKSNPESEGDSVLREDERDASSVRRSDSPTYSSQAKGEFETVDRGPPASDFAESDPESFEWVDIWPEERQNPRENTSVLTLRAREQAMLEQVKDEGSDSDWSFV